MPQFFVSPDTLLDTVVHIRGKEARHIRDVLRLSSGDWVVLCDGAGQRYRAEITDSRPQHVTLTRGEKLPNLSLRHNLTLATAVIRPQRFDWLVEKAFELGCRTLVPLVTERSVDHYVRDATKQHARWSEIALSAAKQSGLPWLPIVSKVTQLSEFLNTNNTQLLYSWEGMAIKSQEADLAPLQRSKDVSLLIGPEGGFSQAEHEAIMSVNPDPLPLGPLILRSETAAIAALIKVML